MLLSIIENIYAQYDDSRRLKSNRDSTIYDSENVPRRSEKESFKRNWSHLSFDSGSETGAAHIFKVETAITLSRVYSHQGSW